jgi:hypothetical protein
MSDSNELAVLFVEGLLEMAEIGGRKINEVTPEQAQQLTYAGELIREILAHVQARKIQL